MAFALPWIGAHISAMENRVLDSDSSPAIAPGVLRCCSQTTRHDAYRLPIAGAPTEYFLLLILITVRLRRDNKIFSRPRLFAPKGGRDLQSRQLGRSACTAASVSTHSSPASP